jgi:O-antigen ligase
MFERIAGALLALFFLSGRYSLAGEGDLASESTLYDVRVWTLLSLVAVSLTYSPPAWRQVARSKCVSTSVVVGMALLLPLYVVLSYSWAIDPSLAIEKMVEAAILAIACLSIVPFWWARRVPIVRHWFWVWLVSATGLMCVVSCYLVDSTRMSVLGGGPNTFGRNMGLLFLGSLYLQRRRSAANWFLYPLMALALLMVVLSGSRGALLATTIGSMIYLLIDNRYRSRNIVAVCGLAVLIQVMALTTEMGNQAMDMFQTRIFNLTIEQQYMSGREDLYQSAYELGFENPLFGQGLAGFTILFGLNYPHNLALELFCETGVVGVGLLAVLLLAALRFVVRHRSHCDPVAWGAFGLLLTSATFSGDFYDSRGVFLMALLASQEIGAVCSMRPKSQTLAPGIFRIYRGSYSPAFVPRN